MLGIDHNIVQTDTSIEIFVSEAKNVTKGTIIHLHGLPGGPAEDNEKLHKLIAPRGYRVVSFNYSGMWKSPGTFTIESSVETLHQVYNFVTEEYSTENIKFFAESYGGTIAIIGMEQKIQPTHIFYRAPLPGIQYFAQDESLIKQLQGSISMLIGAGILNVDVEGGFEKILGNYNTQMEYQEKFKNILQMFPQTNHYVITGKNDEILNYKAINQGYQGAEIEIWDDLSHNNISRPQWIELITKMDIFFQS